MANRPRTRSWSQSEDDSDTPSLTHGQRMTRSSKRGSKVLETVVASPEPEPSKKLSFTPAQTPSTTIRSSNKKKPESEKKKTSKPKTPKSKQTDVNLVPISDEPECPTPPPPVPKSEKKKSTAKKQKKADEPIVQEEDDNKDIVVSPAVVSTLSVKSSKKKKKSLNIDDEKNDEKKEEVPKSSKKKKLNEQNDKIEGEKKNESIVLSTRKKKSAHKRKRRSENGQLKELIDGKTLLDKEEKNRWHMKVHRCRFVGWMPDPIHTLIALPTHLNGNIVAVSRAGGDLELVNVDERWSVTSRVNGPAAGTQASQDGGGDVRALAWVMGSSGGSNIDGVSLVGATLSGVLFEADFRTGLRKRERDSMGGSVWALASPPHCPNSSEQSSMSNVVAAGCEDGSVRLFQLVDDDDGVSGGLELLRTFAPVGSRVTSLAWARSPSGGVGHIYAGTSDGTIHRFDPKTGRNEGRMTLERRGSATGSGSGGRKGEAGEGDVDCVVVWALKALDDGTVVSGDSAGFVQFWDGLTCAFSSRVETHTADVLCLAVSDDEKCVFASGMDHKVVCLRRLSAVPSSMSDHDGQGVWSIAHAYRAHQLDVRALAIVHLSKSTAPEHNAVGPWNPNKNNRDGSTNLAHREILVSGGLDTKLCTYHVRNFTEHRPKRIWPFPYHAVVSLSVPKRLLLAQHRDKLELWQLPPKLPEELSLETQEGNHRLLCELKLNKEGGSALICSAVSGNGHFLAASDALELRLFRLISTMSADGKISSISVQKLTLSKQAIKSAQLLCFSDKKLISATRDGLISVITLPNDQKNNKNNKNVVDVEHSFRFCDDVRKEEHDDDEYLGLPFTALKVSCDGAWLAAAGTKNHVLVYSLDSMSLHWKLPTCASRVTSLAFPPASHRHGDDNSLILSSVDNRIHVYDVERRRLADWSRENGDKFPSQLRFRSDPLVGLSFRPLPTPGTSGVSVKKQSSKLLLRSHGFLCFVDLGAPIPSNARIHPSSHLAAKNDVARRLRHIAQKKRQMKMAAARLLLEKKAIEKEEPGDIKRLRSNSIGSEASITEIPHPTHRERSDSITSMISETGGGGGSKNAVLEDNGHHEEEEEEEDGLNRNFAITLKYRPVIFADYLSSDEMIVVEEPWLKIMNRLPDPLFRQRYGT